MSVSDRFDIYVNDKKKYIAKRGFFSFIIKIKDNQNSLKTTIKRKDFNGIKSNYEVTFPNNSKYRFKTNSYRKGVWELGNEETKYQLYEHEGYAYSLYKDEKQIAFCKKNEMVFLGKDKFEIEADYDVEEKIVIAIFLIIDNAFFVDRGIRFPFNTKFFDDGKHRNWQWQSKKLKNKNWAECIAVNCLQKLATGAMRDASIKNEKNIRNSNLVPF